MSTYADSPLPQGRAQIRLLKIVSKSHIADIKCIFTTFDLDRAPPYQALSYEWGPETPSETIHVMNRPTTIRSNLWNFLSRLKVRSYHDYLWCDAICINQTDDRERSHQVRLMAEIYRRAHSVLVWLGEDRENSNVTLRTIRLISTCSDKNMRHAFLAERQIVWQGLAHLSRRTYWTRVWIVQEVIVARNAILFCGDEMVPWSAFAVACQFPPDQLTPWATELWAPFPKSDGESRMVRSDAGRKLYHSTAYGLIRSQRRWPTYVEPFEDLYVRYKESGCQDKRDRLFALFGIAKELSLRQSFAVDYQKNNEEQFISLIGWSGRGAVEIASRLRFARLAAKALDLDWPNYLTETCTDPEPQRSPTFLRWVAQPLEISLRCRHLGNSLFHVDALGKTGTGDIAPGSFKKEPVGVHLSLDGVKGDTCLDFDLFGFTTSSVLLCCKPVGSTSWIVAAKARYIFNLGRPAAPRRGTICSVFEGLSIVANASGLHRIELKNVAQFMEILLDELDPGVLVEDRRLVSNPLGAGSLSKAKPAEDRGLAEALKGLEITSPVPSTIRGAEEEDVDDTDTDDDSVDADLDRLLAESDPLAKPRAFSAPVEKPRRPRASVSSDVSGYEGSLDPLPERVSVSEDMVLPSSSPTATTPTSNSKLLPKFDIL